MPFVSPELGPCEYIRSLGLAGSNKEFSKPSEMRNPGWLHKQEGSESLEFTTAKSFKRFFLFWVILSSPSGHTYPQSLVLDCHRKRQSKEP